jgi:hypothetical protein
MSDIPVAVVTAADVTTQQRLQLEGGACILINKSDLSDETIDRLLRTAAGAAREPAAATKF